MSCLNCIAQGHHIQEDFFPTANRETPTVAFPLELYKTTKAATRPPSRATGPIVAAAFGVFVADAGVPVWAVPVWVAVAGEPEDEAFPLLQTT